MKRLNAIPGLMVRTGIRDGMAGMKQSLIKTRQKRLEEAERIIDIMVETEIIDTPDEMARTALAYAISVVRTSPGADAAVSIEKTADKLKAAALVLEYTRTKPASKSEVTLNKAEDFLQGLADQANGKR